MNMVAKDHTLPRCHINAKSKTLANNLNLSGFAKACLVANPEDFFFLSDSN